VTTTFPVVAPTGTGTTRLVADHVVGVAVVPLNLTVLVPMVVPKLVPVIVTDVPTGPLVGARVVRLGVGTTVNEMPLLAPPLTVTTTFPVVAFMGTGTTMLLADHIVGVVPMPLKVAVLVPLVAPKSAPVMVTDVVLGPLVGDRFVRLGIGATVNGTPLLATPPTVTTTFPVVAPTGTGTTILEAPHVVGVVSVPLNLRVLVPLVPPKFVPVTVIDLPTHPPGQDRLVMVGTVEAGTSKNTSAEYALVIDEVLYALTAK
jgi:hypothetical protein